MYFCGNQHSLQILLTELNVLGPDNLFKSFFNIYVILYHISLLKVILQKKLEGLAIC